MINILVTGCAGFIGFSLCESLLENGYSVIGVDNLNPFYREENRGRDLLKLESHPNYTFYKLDIRSDLSVLKSQQIDLVIHLAAKTGVTSSVYEIDDYFETNIIGTKNILEFMRSINCSKIIFSSSSSVYGLKCNGLLCENDFSDNPMSPYATTKKAGELLLYNYHHLFNFSVICLRLFSVYGQFQRSDLAIHKFTTLIDKQLPITIYGNGESARDYTFISDIINGFLRSIFFIQNNSYVYEIINIGNQEPVKIKDLTLKLYSLFNLEPNIIFEDSRKEDMISTCANIQKAQTLLTYYPKIKFDDGLKTFFHWFISMKNNEQR